MIITSKRCTPCGGSGKVMGGGMMIHDCQPCKGSGKVSEAIDDIEYLQVKETESYQNAIKNIQKMDSNLSQEEAEDIFKSEFDKLDEKPKPGRPKKE